jgi:Sap, sulfolipid-1-addressing protein
VSDTAEILCLAVAAAFYPTLLAVVILMLARPNPMRTLGFFLGGAVTVSVPIGIVAVFALNAMNYQPNERSVNGPIYLTVGALVLLIGVMLWRAPRKPKAEPKPDDPEKPSFMQRTMSKDSSKLVFVAGMVLDLPGIWYIIGLKDIAIGGYTSAEKVGLVLVFNAIMFSLIEVPLIAYSIATDATSRRVTALNHGLHTHGRRIGAYIALTLGVYFVVRGLVELF